MHEAGHAVRQRVAGYSPSVEAASAAGTTSETSTGAGARPRIQQHTRMMAVALYPCPTTECSGGQSETRGIFHEHQVPPANDKGPAQAPTRITCDASTLKCISTTRKSGERMSGALIGLRGGVVFTPFIVLGLLDATVDHLSPVRCYA